jgi:hypothetical protein
VRRVDVERECGDRGVTASEVEPATATAARPAAGERRPATPAAGRDRLGRWALPAVLAAVLLPIAVAAVRVASGDWVPVGDSALIALRSQDVLGGQVPLLGMWASTSWVAGVDMNHPGPLLFDALAVPTALFGNADGSVVGMALINAAAVAGLYVVCRRRGGSLAAALGLAVAALLCWSLGSAVLVEPWHATAVLLPFLLLCALAWSVADGDLPCLPFAVAVGSFVLQTNLGYAVLVPAVLGWAVVAYGLGRRAERASDGTATSRGEPARPRGVGWAVVAALVVGALCWAQPIAEQLAGEGRGNVSRLWEGVRQPQRTFDWGTAMRSVADVVAVPPWWLRPSYREGFAFGAFGNRLVGLVPAILALAAIAAAVGWCWWDARRRRDRTAAAAAGTAAVVLAAAIVSANQTPTSDAGVVAYQVRYLWPVGAFVALAVAVALARRAPAGGRGARRLVVGAGAVAVVAAVANLPASHQSTTAPEPTAAVASEVVSELGDADLPPLVRVECWEGLFDPYCEAVIAGLAEQGVDVVQPDGQALRQLGTDRRWSGDPEVPMLAVVAGELAGFGPRGARQLVIHLPLSDDEMAELRTIREDIAAALADGELRLDDRGARMARRGNLPSVDGDGSPPDIDVDRAMDYRRYLFGAYRRDIDLMVGEGLLAADEAWSARLDRYAELRRRVDDETVAVYLTTEPSVPQPTG